jgi:iron(III) transport system substrate-binding protein
VSATNASISTSVSLIELTNSIYRGQVALAYPLFGSTATHLLALRQHWGNAAWERWCRALAANKPLIVDGNSVAARMVAKGQVKLGLTDSDDIAAENREGANLKAFPVSGETLLLPNTVGVVRNAPHSESAQRLFEYFQTRAVTERLIQAGALEGALADDVRGTLKPNWDALLPDLEAGTKLMQNIFLR